MFSLSAKTKELFYALWMECRRIAIEDASAMDFREIDKKIDKMDLFWTKRYFRTDIVSGITGRGTTLLDGLAREIRLKNSKIRETIGHSELMGVIYDFVEKEWGKNSNLLEREREIEEGFFSILEMVVREEEKREFHVIPLRLFHNGGHPFDIGPVHFTQQRDFNPIRFGTIEEENTRVVRDVAKICENYEADWIAVVEVTNRERRLSLQVANQATDIALIAPKLMFAAESFTSAARLSGLSRSSKHEMLSLSDGRSYWGFCREDPGLGWSRKDFDQAVDGSKSVFDSIGRRINGYVHRSSLTSVLDQAWCNAAYWFHEALQADLDTVSLVKFETCIEVLVRAENSKGSERRILGAFKAFFGSDPDEKLERSIRFATVKNYAQALVNLRSRVLHGTLSTIDNETTMTRREIRFLCRNLLLNYTADLDEYAKSALIEGKEPLDDIESFLSWAAQKRSKKNRQH